MGRNKIKMESIKNERTRQVTYYKRKKGLLKKSMELSLLCGVKVFLTIVDKKENFTIFLSHQNMKNYIEKYINGSVKPKDIFTLKEVSFFIFIIQYKSIFNEKFEDSFEDFSPPNKKAKKTNRKAKINKKEKPKEEEEEEPQIEVLIKDENSFHSKTVSEPHNNQSSNTKKNNSFEFQMSDGKQENNSANKTSLSEIKKKKNLKLKIPQGNKPLIHQEEGSNKDKQEPKEILSQRIQSRNVDSKGIKNSNRNYIHNQTNNQKLYSLTPTPLAKGSKTTMSQDGFFKEPLPAQSDIENKDKNYPGYMTPMTQINFEQFKKKKTQRDNNNNNYMISPLLSDQNMCFFMRTPNYSSVTPTPNNPSQFDFLSPGNGESPYGGLINFFNGKGMNQNPPHQGSNYQNTTINQNINANINLNSNSNSNHNSNSFTISNPNGSITSSINISLSKSDD